MSRAWHCLALEIKPFGDREKCLDDHVRQESAGFDIQILERNSGDGG